MYPYRLTPTQREVLEALVKLYEAKKRLIKSSEIAKVINKDEGTVRNVVATLKSLGLLESKTGPGGGYMPTLKALEIVKAPPVPSYGVLRVWKEGRELGLAAYAMELIDILNPEGGKAVVRISGNLEEVKEGDLLRIGPAPYTRLFVEGVVASVDRASGQLVLKVRRLVSIPREPVSEIASKELVAVKPEDSLKEVAELLLKKKIRGAPVLEDKKVVGIITMTDVARAFVDGKLDAKVRAYMRKNVVTIREDEDILEAVKLMDLYGVGRLVVVDAVGKPVGIVTRTDVLRRIAAMSTS